MVSYLLAKIHSFHYTNKLFAFFLLHPRSSQQLFCEFVFVYLLQYQ